MGHTHGPKTSSNHNRFVVWPTWIFYSYYNEDDKFSSKLVDPGKRMGSSVEKRGHWNMAENHDRNERIIYHFCTETYWRWKSTTSTFLCCIRESIRDCHLLKNIVWRKGQCQPTILEIENCTEAEDVTNTTRIAGIVNWYENPQVCIKRIAIGKYQNNRMDWFAMCIKLDQDQETATCLCSKQITRNHGREECRVPVYLHKRESSRPTK